MRVIVLCVIVLISIPKISFGQSNNTNADDIVKMQRGDDSFITDNRRCKKVAPNQIVKDDEIIAPESIILKDSSLSDYKVEILSSREFVIKGPSSQTFLEVCYRVLPKDLQKKFTITAVGRYDSTVFFRPVQDKNDPFISRREELFDLGEINQGGQISRGITVGNTQDLFVNSSLNLNLEGKISNDLNIRASITDQSLPYQPEGNTQQLQDFDNVFVELFNDRFSLVGGDIVMQNKETHFLRYLKNVQGGALSVKTKNSSSAFGLSAAKGQFASVNVPVSEGILGPYEVRAPGNASSVIIIANSEKVFIDGKLMTRGYNNDYTIDYNQAEINFTSNVIINNYSRVRVDYEYAVRDYARSIISFSHNQKIGKVNLAATYYREGDNPNKPLYTELSQSDKELLETVGNEVDQAVVPSANLTEYSPDRTLYYLQDTIDSSNTPRQIYVHTTDELDSLYSISFTDVGAGMGSYVIKEYLAQGRVYSWVGSGNGMFEPFKQLAAPGRKEMLDLTASLQMGKYSKIYVESAFSNHDRNQFSTLGNESNKGFALKGGVAIHDKPIDGFGEYKLQLSADVEFLDKNFSAIDRFRRVEFDRDWSYKPSDSIAAHDFVLSSSIGLRKDATNGFLYQFNNRNKENEVVGNQHNLLINKGLGKLQINVDAFLMNSKLTVDKASWKNLFSEAYLKGIIQPGYRFIFEQNLISDYTDSIISSINYFAAHELFIRNNPESKTKFELAYSIRDDKTPLNGELYQSGKSENARAKLATTINENHNLSLVLNYRVFDDLLTVEDAVESITGRIDWTGDIIKQVFRSELNYSVANARVPKREYVFVEVPTGQGTHTWRDDNLDGIKDLNEFYEAIHFDERNYIKLYVNTTEFVDAFENIFNYRATLNAPRSWRTKPGILHLLSKISNTTSWASHYRTTEDNLNARLIPFLADIDESQVLSLREALRTTFFINKTNPKFGISTGYANFRKKFLYTNGFESRSDEEINISARWNLTRQYNLKINSVSASRANRSDYLEGRNYDIRDYKIGPSFSWQPKPTFRLSGSYIVGIKNSSNSIELPSRSSLNEVLAEMKMGMVAKYMINMNVKYSRVTYDGDELTPVGYEMLQGLRPGDNISWSIGWQQKLINGLQVNLYYEGRKPNGIEVIHSGRASVSALF
jgi:hypothetical protein